MLVPCSLLLRYATLLSVLKQKNSWLCDAKYLIEAYDAANNCKNNGKQWGYFTLISYTSLCHDNNFSI